MDSLVFVMLAAGAVALLWSAARAAAEAASRHGREACRGAGVQWLDHSVQLVRVRVVRARDGRLRLERHYRFEYSRGGDDRHAGRIVLLGRALSSITGPLPDSDRPPDPGPAPARLP